MTIECTQRPGEMLYVPDLWGHVTLNLQESIGVALELGPPAVALLDVWAQRTRGRSCLVNDEGKGEAVSPDGIPAWRDLPSVRSVMERLDHPNTKKEPTMPQQAAWQQTEL